MVRSDGARVRQSNSDLRTQTFGPSDQTIGPDHRTGPSHPRDWTIARRTLAPSDRTAAYLRTASDTLNAAPGIATPAIS